MGRRKESRVARYFLEYVLFRMTIVLLRIIPIRCAGAFSRWFAPVIVRWFPRKWTRQALVEGHLRQAFGENLSDQEIQRITIGMWAHLIRLVFEVIQMKQQLTSRTFRKIVKFRGGGNGPEQLEEQPTGPEVPFGMPDLLKALLTRRPVLLCSGHLGQWELAVSILGTFGFSLGVVARDLENPWLNRWFADFRKQTGHELISKKDALDKVGGFLEAGKSVALLFDQDAGQGGEFVEFLGKPASTTRAVALLAQRFDAYICVGYGARLPDRPGEWSQFELGIEDVIDPRDFSSNRSGQSELVQRMSQALERAVRRYPEQYFWLHRRWKSSPKIRERLRKAG